MKLTDSILAMSKEAEREETKEETHELEDSKQEELDEEDEEEELDEGVEWNIPCLPVLLDFIHQFPFVAVVLFLLCCINPTIRYPYSRLCLV